MRFFEFFLYPKSETSDQIIKKPFWLKCPISGRLKCGFDRAPAAPSPSLALLAWYADTDGDKGRALSAQVATARACPHAHGDVPLGLHFPHQRLRSVPLFGFVFLYVVLPFARRLRVGYGWVFEHCARWRWWQRGRCILRRMMLLGLLHGLCWSLEFSSSSTACTRIERSSVVVVAHFAS